MVPVTCPSCRRSETVPEEFLGRQIKCRPCGTNFVAVTGATAPTADVPARLPGPAYPTPAATAPRKTKDCPFCGETILAAAVKCKHCSEFLDPALRAAVVAPQPVAEPAPFRRYDEPVERPRVITPSMQAVQQTVVVRVGNEYRVPHLIHLLLTLCTAGIWLPIWLIHSALNSRRA